jgi:hypothetical protein
MAFSARTPGRLRVAGAPVGADGGRIFFPRGSAARKLFPYLWDLGRVLHTVGM